MLNPSFSDSLFDVRPATPDDAESILRMHHESLVTTYPEGSQGITRAQMEERYRAFGTTEERIRYWRTRAETQGSTHILFVAQMDGDGELVGFINSSRPPDGLQRLGPLYVAVDYINERRIGIGTALARKALAWLNNGDLTWVQVGAHLSAVMFYERLGFVRQYDVDDSRAKRLGVVELQDVLMIRPPIICDAD